MPATVPKGQPGNLPKRAQPDAQVVLFGQSGSNLVPGFGSKSLALVAIFVIFESKSSCIPTSAFQQRSPEARHSHYTPVPKSKLERMYATAVRRVQKASEPECNRIQAPADFVKLSIPFCFTVTYRNWVTSASHPSSTSKSK